MVYFILPHWNLQISIDTHLHVDQFKITAGSGGIAMPLEEHECHWLITSAAFLTAGGHLAAAGIPAAAATITLPMALSLPRVLTVISAGIPNAPLRRSMPPPLPPRPPALPLPLAL